MAILTVRDQYGNVSEIPAIKGKSPYEYAKDGGYTGTEEEFAELLANSTDKRNISLGIASDGLIYLFVDGAPVGTGIPQGQNGDVFGYVDENNTIVLTGNLADGIYSIKYELEDGSTVDIGELVLDTTETPSYTNVLPQSVDVNDNLFVGDNGEKGYKTGYRLSNSTGGEVAEDGVEVTGYISVKQGDVVRVKNITLSSTSTDGIVLIFDSNKTKIDSRLTADLFASDEGNGVYASAPITTWSNLGFIRFASSNIDETSIVTINEEIV